MAKTEIPPLGRADVIKRVVDLREPDIGEVRGFPLADIKRMPIGKCDTVGLSDDAVKLWGVKTMKVCRKSKFVFIMTSIP